MVTPCVRWWFCQVFTSSVGKIVNNPNQLVPSFWRCYIVHMAPHDCCCVASSAMGELSIMYSGYMVYFERLLLRLKARILWNHPHVHDFWPLHNCLSFDTDEKDTRNFMLHQINLFRVTIIVVNTCLMVCNMMQLQYVAIWPSWQPAICHLLSVLAGNFPIW